MEYKITNKKRLAAIAFMCLAAGTILWTSAHSRVKLSSSLPTPVFVVKNITSGEIRNVSGNNKTITLKKGRYEIVAKGENESYIGQVHTKRFLATTVFNAKPHSEHSRFFVGDNPLPCMLYSGKLLVTYHCGDYIGDAKIHVPASEKIPTYTKVGISKMLGKIVNSFRTPDGIAIVVRTPILGESLTERYSYNTLLLDGDVSLQYTVTTGGTIPTKKYQAIQEGDGYMLYDLKSGDGLSFSDFKDDSPSYTVLPTRDKNDLDQVSFDVRGKQILTLFSTPSDSSKKYSELHLNTGGKAEVYEYEGAAYSDAKVCGSYLVCLTDGARHLDIYKIKNNESTLVCSLSGVVATKSLGDTLIAVDDAGVLNVDSERCEAFYSYTFGRYIFNNISADAYGYTLSLTKPDNRKVALRVDNGTSDKIDSKIISIQKISEINYISIYKKNIYIAANLGNLVYDSNTRNYSYDSSKKNHIAKKINAAIDSAGIDRNTYSIASNAF